MAPKYLPTMRGKNVPYYPQNGSYVPGRSEVGVDPAGNMSIRGAILTDEGNWRANYSSSSPALVVASNGIVANGSTVVDVNGGTSFELVDVHAGDYVWFTSDGQSYAIQVESVDDTILNLVSPYLGTGGTGSVSRSVFFGSTGVDPSPSTVIQVSGGALQVHCGTAGSNIVQAKRLADTLPLGLRFGGNFNAVPHANTTPFLGVYVDTSVGSRAFAKFEFTNALGLYQFNCTTGWNESGNPSGTSVETVVVKLPANALIGGDITTFHVWGIDVLPDKCVFSVDGIVVAILQGIVPHPTDLLTVAVRFDNAASAPTDMYFNMKFCNCRNINLIDAAINPSTTVTTIPNVPPPVLMTGVVGVMGNVDCRGYKYVRIWVVSNAGTTTITPAWSDSPNTATFINSPATWTPVAGGASVATFTTASITTAWVSPIQGNYLRITGSSAANGIISVQLLNDLELPRTTTPASQAVTGTVTASNTAGTTAANVAVASNPVQIAGIANVTGAAGNALNTVTGSVARLNLDSQGSVIVQAASEVQKKRFTSTAGATIENTTTPVTLFASPSASVHITDITISHDALSAPVDLIIESATTPTVIWRQRLQMAACPINHMSYTVPVKGVSGQDVRIKTSAAVTGAIYVVCTGYNSNVT